MVSIVDEKAKGFGDDVGEEQTDAAEKTPAGINGTNGGMNGSTKQNGDAYDKKKVCSMQETVD